MDEGKLLDPAQLPECTEDMDAETFRHYGHQVIDWIADYLAQSRAHPVLAQTAPGDIRRAIPQQAPEQPVSMAEILADFESIVIPGITHWNAPGFMAYFSATASGPGILGEILASALNVNAMLWRTSPAATELEQVTLDWLRQMLGLPASFFGIINDTASSSTLYALTAAREAIADLHIREQGLHQAHLRFYASQEAHSSVDKAGIVLGIGQAGLRKISVDEEYRMNCEELAMAIAEDIATGWTPFAVVATVGTTSTTSIDPVPQIAAICKRFNLWLHVDGAYGGSAAVDPSMRWVLNGCEHADSFVVNPHKWLFTPIDCSVLYTSKPAMLKKAFSLVPEFLTSNAPQEDVVNFMDYGVALGRRFRSLKLWMILRYFGHQGLASRIHEQIRIASVFATWIAESPLFEIMAPHPFSTICFRFHPPAIQDEATLNMLNETIMQHINSKGNFFLSHTKIQGKYVIRVAIGNMRTTEQDIQTLWQELQLAIQYAC